MTRLLAGVIASLVAWTLPAPPAQSADCSGNRYLVKGAVRDRAGDPVPSAQVHVLLDKVSEKKFLKQGVRARSFRADDEGRYTATIVCGGEGGQPNPCAKNPKHLTVAAQGPDHGLKLVVFKLSDLPVTSLAGDCLIEAPGIVLGPPL
jgi:protocatechuate 3,4-dioxygenase beta subunit